jgi:transposase-like protein
VTHHDSDLSDLLDALRAGEMTDTIRTSLEWIIQELIEAEATAKIGAAPFERSDERTTQRNGHRPRLWSTKAGDLGLKIPKLRTGSFFPVAARATPPHRPGPLRGGDGGVGAWCVDPQGR